jgi:aryl-alcohol dehydrogenase-like predicted oxidoreductase
MIFRRLGASGLQVPIISLGGWLTYGELIIRTRCSAGSEHHESSTLLGGTVQGDRVKDIIKTAFEAGIN